MHAKRELIAEARELLVAAAERLDSPQRWSRRAYALDACGKSVRVDDARAVRFCLSGALLRAEHELHGTAIRLRTAETPEPDDLLVSPLPRKAPARLQLALDFLSVGTGVQFALLGVRFRAVGARKGRRIPTTRHRPLLLGLHPRARFRDCRQALVHSWEILDWIVEDPARVDKLIRARAIS